MAKNKDIGTCPAIPAFNNCSAQGMKCAGHANHMLDLTYTHKKDRDMMVKIISHYSDTRQPEVK